MAMTATTQSNSNSVKPRFVFEVFMRGSSSFLAERQRCGAAEAGRPERSERGTLSAVATTVLFGELILG